MPARFADRPPRLPASNPSVGRPVILEVDKFAGRDYLSGGSARNRTIRAPRIDGRVASRPKSRSRGFRAETRQARTRQTQQAGAHRIATQRRAIRSRAHRSRLAALPRHSGRRPASPICNASVSSVDLVGQAVQLGRPSRTVKAGACPRRRTSEEPAAGAPAPATRTTVRATRRWTVS